MEGSGETDVPGEGWNTNPRAPGSVVAPCIRSGPRVRAHTSAQELRFSWMCSAQRGIPCSRGPMWLCGLRFAALLFGEQLLAVWRADLITPLSRFPIAKGCSHVNAALPFIHDDCAATGAAAMRTSHRLRTAFEAITAAQLWRREPLFMPSTRPWPNSTCKSLRVANFVFRVA